MTERISIIFSREKIIGLQAVFRSVFAIQDIFRLGLWRGSSRRDDEEQVIKETTEKQSPLCLRQVQHKNIRMRFDEILRTHVVIGGVKHIPYPEACPKASVIRECDYRVHEEIHDINHDKCEIGFNGYFACGEERPCMYADRPSMCPVFMVSCLDCEHISRCDREMFFVALTLNPAETSLERATHPLYR